jgi:hypothetical protein
MKTTEVPSSRKDSFAYLVQAQSYHVQSSFSSVALGSYALLKGTYQPAYSGLSLKINDKSMEVSREEKRKQISSA